jgi:hypothetical protein
MALLPLQAMAAPVERCASESAHSLDVRLLKFERLADIDQAQFFA